MRFLVPCLAVACAFTLSTVPAAFADGSDCQPVHGKIQWTVIPAPNEPFGRVLGSVTGLLAGPSTDSIQSVSVGPGGVTTTVDFPIFMTGKNDLLFGESHATFIPLPGPVGFVSDSQTITITGGTGKFSGATGVINADGVGHNLFGPEAGPGSTFFTLDYDGAVCGVRDGK